MIGLKLNRHQTMLAVYVTKFGKNSVAWRYTLHSFGPSAVLLYHMHNISYNNQELFFTFVMSINWAAIIDYI